MRKCLSLPRRQVADDSRIIKHPRQNFTIIVNPNSGPGSSPYPSDDYTSQIQRLNTFSNVQTLGYVHTSYAQRDVQSVLKDISTYSGWAKGSADANMPGFAVHGIFVDEVPSVYSPEAVEYLQTVNAAIKKAPGLLGNKLVSVSLRSII
jgi:Spherulation-specific family 4